MILGKISSIGEGVTLIIEGEQSPTTKKFQFLTSYIPKVGDRVLIEEISGTYVVIGSFTADLSKAGKVAYADKSGYANSAGSATSANTAGSATSAETATTANKGKAVVNQTYPTNNGFNITFSTDSNGFLYFRVGGGNSTKLAKG